MTRGHPQLPAGLPAQADTDSLSQRAELAEAEMAVIRALLEPDLLFNSLNSLACLAHANPLEAEDLACSIGLFLRMVLGSAGSRERSIRRELEFVQAFLKIEKLRAPSSAVECRHEPGVLEMQIPAGLLLLLIRVVLASQPRADAPVCLRVHMAVHESILTVRARHGRLPTSSETLLQVINRWLRCVRGSDYRFESRQLRGDAQITTLTLSTAFRAAAEGGEELL